MVWFRIDDGFHSHPKVLAIPRRDRLAAIGLWTLAGGWCAKQLTDGYLASHMLEELGGTSRLASTLVEVGLWEVQQNGYLYHDWADHNPTREDVESERKAARERMKRVRSGRSTGGSAPEVRPNNKRSSEEVRLTRPDPTRPVVPTGTTGTPRKRHIPDDWRPNAAHIARAAQLELDLAAEVEQFRDYDKAKGPIWKDFDAAFNTWLRNQARWGKSPRGPYPSKQDETDDLFGSALERARARDNQHQELTS